MFRTPSSPNWSWRYLRTFRTRAQTSLGPHSVSARLLTTTTPAQFNALLKVRTPVCRTENHQQHQIPRAWPQAVSGLSSVSKCLLNHAGSTQFDAAFRGLFSTLLARKFDRILGSPARNWKGFGGSLTEVYTPQFSSVSLDLTRAVGVFPRPNLRRSRVAAFHRLQSTRPRPARATSLAGILQDLY